MFKHELGSIAESKSTGLKGAIMARAEHLHGCNRYYIQPRVEKEMKLPDGYWIDEADLRIIEKGTQKTFDDLPPGGPISKNK
jgi:hypothetical protein